MFLCRAATATWIKNSSSSENTLSGTRCKPRGYSSSITSCRACLRSTATEPRSNRVRHYLRNYSYAGAMQFGQLDFKEFHGRRDTLVLSGVQSYGGHFSNTRVGPVLCCQLVYHSWLATMAVKAFVGQSGGPSTSMNLHSRPGRLTVTDTAENFLYRYTPAGISALQDISGTARTKRFSHRNSQGAREDRTGIWKNSARTLKTKCITFPKPAGATALFR